MGEVASPCPVLDKKVDRLLCKSRNLKASYLETAWWFLGWPHPMSENEAGT